MNGGLFRSRLQEIERIAFPQPRVDPFDLGYVAPFSTDLDAPQATLPDAAAEDSADAPPVVIAAPERDMRAEARKLLAPVWTHLDNLEDDEQRSDLLQQLNSFTEALGTFLTDHRQALVARLTAEHQAAVLACRKQRQVVENARFFVDDYVPEIRRINAQLSEARAKLKNLLEAEPSLDAWPSAAELQRWKDSCQQVRAEIDAAAKRQSELFEEDRILRTKLAAEESELAKLAQQERRLRDRLSGKPYTDEDGLVSPPEL